MVGLIQKKKKKKKKTPDRIWLPPLLEWTTQDLASPHLLCCNPAPNPSLDFLLGHKWLVLHERLGKLQERGLELCTHCCRPDTRVVIEAALPEAAALDRRVQPPTVLEIGDTSLPQHVSSPRRRSSRRQSRKRRRNRSMGVYRPPKRSPPHWRWCK